MLGFYISSGTDFCKKDGIRFSSLCCIKIYCAVWYRHQGRL